MCFWINTKSPCCDHALPHRDTSDCGKMVHQPSSWKTGVKRSCDSGCSFQGESAKGGASRSRRVSRFFAQWRGCENRQTAFRCGWLAVLQRGQCLAKLDHGQRIPFAIGSKVLEYLPATCRIGVVDRPCVVNRCRPSIGYREIVVPRCGHQRRKHVLD